MTTNDLDRLNDDHFKRQHYTEAERMDKYFNYDKKSVKETDSTMSKFIQKHIQQHGGICLIYKAGGTYRQGKQQVVEKGFFNVTLQTKKSGYTKSNATSGASDTIGFLSSTKGELIVWFAEVKLPGDRIREDQKAFEQMAIEFAKTLKVGKCVYSIVTSREDFTTKYNSLIN